MTLALPGGLDDDSERQQKFDQIAQAMPGFGGKSVEIRYGTTVLTWTASTTSAGATVSHGLGKTPQIVVATVGAYGSSNAAHAQVGGFGATTFNLQGQITAGAALTGTLPCYWIAIG